MAGQFKFLHKGVPRYLSACGGGWLLVIGLFVDQVGVLSRIALLLPGVILALSGFFLGEYRSRSKSRERQDAYRKAVAASESFEVQIQSLDLSDALDSSAQRIVGGNSWRLNVYLLEGVRWKRVARRATDPYFEVGGRLSIERNESMLIRLLDKGLRDAVPAVEVTGEFPDATLSQQDWIRAQEEWNTPAEVARLLRLKSRRYAACAVRLDGSKGDVVALTIEVLEPQGLDEIIFRRAVTRDVLTLLAKLITAESAVRAARDIVVEVEPWHRSAAVGD